MKNIIIAWRFNNSVDKKPRVFGEINLIPIFTPDDKEKSNIKRCTLKGEKDNEFKRLKTIVNSKAQGEILVLIHDIQFYPDQIDQIKEICPEESLILFCGGGRETIYNILDTGTGDFKELDNNKLIDIWNVYNYKKKLLRFKHKIITSWLPLAIDIQGLSDVDSDKREEYFNDIITSYTDNSKEIRETLEEIIKEEIEMDNIDECVKFLKFFSRKKVDLEKFYEKYCESKKAEFFLPAWLKNVAKKIDEKIKQY